MKNQKSNDENKQAWVVAKEGRARTIRAAQAALAAMDRDGVAGYARECPAYSELCEVSTWERTLGSDYPANYWLFHAHRDPQSWDETAWVARKEQECRNHARQPRGVV